MRIALRQQAQQRRQRREAVQRRALIEETRGARRQQLNSERAEMILNARPPRGENKIAGLQRGPHGG